MFQFNASQAPRWYLTSHLRRRAAERGITEDEVMLMGVLADPEVTYEQETFGPNRQVCQRGRLGVVVDRSTGAVITVVFRSGQAWLAQLSKPAT